MRKLFDFESSAQRYTADAVAVCCFDARIRPVTSEFLRRNALVHPDMVIVAGGGLALSSPRTEFDRAFVMEQVRLAIQLHRAGRVILMSHADCGTYGGLAAFDGDRARERRSSRRDLLAGTERARRSRERHCRLRQRV